MTAGDAGSYACRVSLLQNDETQLSLVRFSCIHQSCPKVLPDASCQPVDSQSLYLRESLLRECAVYGVPTLTAIFSLINAGSFVALWLDIEHGILCIKCQFLKSSRRFIQAPFWNMISNLCYCSCQLSFSPVHFSLAQVKNAHGAVSSAVVVVTVTPRPTGRPIIVTQPASCSVAHLDNFALTVVAAGVPPLTYQWWAGSAPVEGATQPRLLIEGARKTQHQGLYCVQVSIRVYIATRSASGPVLHPGQHQGLYCVQAGTAPGKTSGRGPGHTSSISAVSVAAHVLYSLTPP